ncbi:polysaccharide deacetylase [Methanosphaerula palustris E1-9c]|uniref:Polysaccharide deacetylase n=2 Tax=Methanosphaerula palustris TaxID=475088 RepID=B8GGD8_METPE|nr:polysaccharide deacetylase [Methanosphaerula palustris E1-9c]
MNKRNASLSVTVDIEDWYHIPSVCGSSFSTYPDVDGFFKHWHGRYDYLTEPTMRVLTLLDRYHITATFFVVADVVEHYPGLVESIVDQGHEIACHGLHHECKIDSVTKKPRFGRDDFEERTRKAKRILEKVSGERVVGYRAPNALIGGWMLDSLEKIGFLYDSSVCVNSFYNKTDSMLNGVSTDPYHPKIHGLESTINSDRSFIEFPWAHLDIGMKIPTSGGPMLRFLGAHIIQKGIHQSLSRGHTVFYFHPIDLSHETFPKVGNKRRFYWIIKGSVVEDRVKQILDGNSSVQYTCLRDYVEDGYGL